MLFPPDAAISASDQIELSWPLVAILTAAASEEAPKSLSYAITHGTSTIAWHRSSADRTSTIGCPEQRVHDLNGGVDGAARAMSVGLVEHPRRRVAEQVGDQLEGHAAFGQDRGAGVPQFVRQHLRQPVCAQMRASSSRVFLGFHGPPVTVGNTSPGSTATHTRAASFISATARR